MKSNSAAHFIAVSPMPEYRPAFATLYIVLPISRQNFLGWLGTRRCSILAVYDRWAAEGATFNRIHPT